MRTFVRPVKCEGVAAALVVRKRGFFFVKKRFFAVENGVLGGPVKGEGVAAALAVTGDVAHRG